MQLRPPPLLAAQKKKEKRGKERKKKKKGRRDGNFFARASRSHCLFNEYYSIEWHLIYPILKSIYIQCLLQLANRAFIIWFDLHILLMIFFKCSVKCPVFRSEYQNFLARPTRSYYLIEVRPDHY